MAGEISKKSGDIGEKIAEKLLEKIGWKEQIHNISIACSDDNHVNSSGNQKKSHGEDIIYLYDTPFHDDTTVIAHISVKHKMEGYGTSESAVTSEFRSHIKGLEEIIACAKYDEEFNSLIGLTTIKKNRKDIGILIWLHSNKNEIDRSILPIIAKSRPDLKGDTPYYIIDSARASFLLKVINDLEKRSNKGEYQFYYPKIGTSISVESDRKGHFLPIELIVSDIIPAIVSVDSQNQFYLYSREIFSDIAYKNLIAYALNFSAGLVSKIYIGFPDYNSVINEDMAKMIRSSFKDRREEIIPFSYNSSILDLLQE